MVLGSQLVTDGAHSRLVMLEATQDVFPVVPPQAILTPLPASQAFGTVVPNLAFSTSVPAGHLFGTQNHVQVVKSYYLSHAMMCCLVLQFLRTYKVV